MGLDTVVVSQAHTIDDLSTDLARFKRAAGHAFNLLAIAQEASENGNVPVTQEYVDRARAALGKALGLAGIESSGPEL